MRGLLSAAVAVALLAALESLLSAKVADGMADNGRHDPDRELFGQGLANLASPLFGGMPATGAIARTAVNVRAGALALAAAFHSLVLLMVVFFGGGLVAEIPLAALAGVLMVTAVRMVEPHNVRAVLRSTRSDAIVLVLTAAATVAFDLIVAVEIGIAVAAALALRHVANTSEAQREALPPDELVDRRPRSRPARPAHRRLPLRRRPVLRRLPTLPHRAHRRQRRPSRHPAPRPDPSPRRHRRPRPRRDRPRARSTAASPSCSRACGPSTSASSDAVGALDRLAHERHIFDRLPDAIAHARTHIAREPHHNAA